MRPACPCPCPCPAGGGDAISKALDDLRSGFGLSPAALGQWQAMFWLDCANTTQGRCAVRPPLQHSTAQRICCMCMGQLAAQRLHACMLRHAAA